MAVKRRGFAVHVLVARVVGKESAAILLLQEIGDRIDAMAAAAVDKAGLSALRALRVGCTRALRKDISSES
jgi:hypothetical protein